MYLLTECSKLMVNEIDFQDSIMVLGFPEELNKELLSLYQENCQEIRSILSEMAMDLPHYHNLEWRLDVQVASRALQRQAQPSVLLRLHAKDGEELDSHLMQTDPSNLVHLTQSLELSLIHI